MKYLKDTDNLENCTNKVLCGDCLDLMAKMPDGCLDLVITDPPYGDGIGYGRNEKTIANNEDESINYVVLDKIWRLMKNDTSLYLFTNWKFEVKLRNYIENKTEFNIRMLLVIVKNNFGMGYGFRNQHELCLVLEKGKPKYNDNSLSNVIRMNHIQHTEDTHPHEKGLSIINKLVQHSSKEGDLVFDPFMGSGTTAKMAKINDRNYIGSEISSEYCEIIKKRLAQQTLL